jgi:cardiolipin synthase (CMP-forming)
VSEGGANVGRGLVLAGPARHLPNVITVLRILLVLPMAWVLAAQNYLMGVVLMVVAGASDGLDGWLARRFAWTTRFGATADPLADKLLVGVLFVILTLQAHLPLWLVALVVTRDLLILGGALAYRGLFGPAEFKPTFVSKCNTAAQLLLLLTLLVGLSDIPYISALALWLVYPWLISAVAVLGVWSGMDYLITWSRRAAAERGPGRR